MSGRLPNRMLYTGDCTYLFADPAIYCPGGEPYTARVVHDHIDRLADSGVDTYLCSPQAQGNWWPSRRVPNIFAGYRRGDHDFVMPHAKCVFWNLAAVDREELAAWAARQVAFFNRYLDLAEAGIDWVAECAKACRRRGIAPWLTLRMNDMHGRNIHGNPGEQDSCFNAPVYRDPVNRLPGIFSGRAGRHTTESGAGMDYTRAAVREFILATIGELLDDYDFEGLELDWLRNPICCEPDAPQESVDLVTAFHAEIRRLTRVRAAQTGKPFVLGLRVPPAFDLLRSIGLDVVEIVRQGLVDFVNPSNHWQTSWDLPYDEYRRILGPDVAIYGVVECGANGMLCQDATRDTTDFRRQPVSPELMRGNAAGKLVMGVDGLETFNFFCADSRAAAAVARYDLLAELADLARLRGRPKQYVFSNMFGHCWYPPFEHPEQLPVALRPSWRRRFRLTMCAEPAGAGLELVVQVIAERRADLPVLGVRFNGCWPHFDGKSTDQLLFAVGGLTRHVPAHQAWNFTFPVSAIRDGWNEIELFHPTPARSATGGPAGQDVTVLGVELAVRHAAH